MRIAGIDPSLSNFGLVKGHLSVNKDTTQLVLTDMQLVQSEADKKSAKSVRKNSDDLRRAQTLCKATKAFIEDVDLVFVEVPVGSQSARSMASYGICIGILGSVTKPIIQVTPAEVKIAATGSKTASKMNMIDWAMNLYPSLPWLFQKRHGVLTPVNKNEHLADSIGAVHAGIRTDEFAQLMAFHQLPPIQEVA